MIQMFMLTKYYKEQCLKYDRKQELKLKNRINWSLYKNQETKIRINGKKFGRE